MAKIYVIHENSPWVEPLREAFDNQKQPYEEWFLNEGVVPLHQDPPQGVFYNRMSASSHTRGHRFGPELTHATLNWLEGAGRRVINGTRALYLEISKIAQYTALQSAGVLTPKTTAAVGRDEVLRAAESFGPGPWILKPNRGGKGLGVQLFRELDAIAAYLDGPGAGEEAPIDGVWLIQDYIPSPEKFITRAEFVGGRFLYAVRVDTSEGFELCPADACNIQDTLCPADAPAKNKFEIVQNFEDSPENRQLIERFELFLAANKVEVAGIEFIRDRDGCIFTYDINTNTNYNADAEAAASLRESGMQAISRFLSSELQSHYPSYKNIAAAE